ncbi:TadE/TadG family type IV pilus assembly protein [Devosia sediminis]|uniref:Flp pilus-assembly TadG-like N-terminal domain-containing protein n=1 Tax=Devosia sediminis TaxID=2798801 RepID=A0A934IUW1_9HYPH|nr:TadE/TadG family type IV pilus assembly protein [Devosia sediminis]MBJ3784792.1 hypothetical protein [Devosia sediminis]
MFQLRPLLRRFGSDESGVFAVIFGLMAIVLVALGGATVDFVSLEQARQRAQVALDAAVLALQPDMYAEDMTEAEIREYILRSAQDLVLERIGKPGIINAQVDRITMDFETGRLFLGGDFTMPTMFVSLVGVTQLGSSFSAEAVRGSVDIEVAVALDVTGSMGGARIAALKAAVGDLVDVIVQDQQEPTYSKVALVPYSQAVNAGGYAAALRGPVRDAKTISSMSWASGSTMTITAATKASPVEIRSSSNHGLASNDWVYVFEVEGMTQINNRAFQIDKVNASRFTLRNVDGRNYGNFTKGKFVKCHVANCATVFTSNNHGYSNNDWVRVTDVATWQLGNGINNTDYRVTNATTNTLQLSGYSTNHTAIYTANSGKLHCTWQNASEGCTYFRYQGLWGTYTYPITDCVTDRVTPINDRAPSTTFVGRNYVPSGICPNTQIVPLTDDRDTLHDTIDNLPATGNTAGSLGILWAWYMLSPNFGYVWPEISRPAPYGKANLLKAAIIMTDGEFNTVHCNGAVSADSAGGWDRINCNAPNGEPYKQARDYCDGMRAADIVVYTVGFGITAGSAAANVLNYCASTPSHAYLASNAASLSAAFDQIARNISSLRLTQ